MWYHLGWSTLAAFARPSALQSGHQLLGLPGLHGPVAQLGERRPRMAEVRGSSPLGSTLQTAYLRGIDGKVELPRSNDRGVLLQPYCNERTK